MKSIIIHSISSCLLILTLILFSCQPDTSSQYSSQSAIPDQIDFNFHIKPILSDRCFACHGPDEKAREADLRLDIEAEAFAALKESKGYAIVKGKPQESAIVKRIYNDDPDELMPPPESEMSLTDAEKETITRWIEQGAEWKDHWAFIPPEKPALPEVSKTAWAANDIDQFVLNTLEERGLSPAKEASKSQWLRRVSFDITGLPPSPEQIEAFVQDASEDAYEHIADQLLASPAYGERMASVWLDVARYADSHGYQDDRPRTIWPWRDWVIKAFNENMPYDQFATWQIAGDLLPDATYEQQLATAFNRNHAITQEGGVVQEEYLTEYAADRSHTFSTAFLGLTVECSRCHSHKYDPISQEEYYSQMGFFNNITAEQGQINYFDEAPRPSIEMVDTIRDQHIAEVRSWIQRKEADLQAFSQSPNEAFEAWADSYDPNNQEEDLAHGCLADFSLDEMNNGLFSSRVSDKPRAQMNINLPAKIDLPTHVEGHSGKALAFDGKNFLSLGEIGDFEWYDDFSFGGWIQHSGAHEKDAGIFSRRNGEQKRQGYDLVLTPDNRLSARLIHQYYISQRKDRKGVHYAIDVQTKSRIPAGKWQHVFVSYDGSGQAAGLSIFLNGIKQDCKIKMDSLRGKTILNGNDFLVGNWNHRMRELGDLYGFKGGMVDGIKLFDRQLSPVEVRAIAGNTSAPSRQELWTHFLLTQDTQANAIQQTLDSLRRIDISKPRIMVMQEVDTIKTTYLLNRGAYDAKVKEVNRGTIAAVLPFSPDLPQNRLGLAQWLFDEQHPLTSRVIVNRFWQLFFGRGLVRTPEDFGNQGALPSHPELLDWLAVNFRESGWNMKGLVKQIVLSRTYRQDSYISDDSYAIDPDNVWLSRGPNQRLMAEMLRDQALVASELYYQKIGGKWVKPYQPAGVWKELANQIGENKYRPSRGNDLYRRSLYSYWKRTIPPPSMLTLDASERAVCTVKRQQTSTPLQSLILLNDPIFVEASRTLAEKMMSQLESEQEQIQQAFYRIVSREPEQKEQTILQNLYQDELQRFNQEEEQAADLLAIGASTYSSQLDVPQLAAMTVVVNTIFNLDEAKYK